MNATMNLPQAGGAWRASWLVIMLFAFEACITTSEVGLYPPEEKAGAPALPPDPGGGAASADGGLPVGKKEPPRLAPVRTRIAAGATSTCAIDSKGGAFCWGDKERGQRGAGDRQNIDASREYYVWGLDRDVDAIFGGGDAHCARKRNGEVLCWGDTVYEESTDGILRHSIEDTPRPIEGLSDIATVALGQYFECALTTSRQTKCFGLDDDEVPEMGDEGESLAAGQSGHFACAVTTAGALKCWGDNGRGQPENDTSHPAPRPTPVMGLETKVTGVAVGSEHACAIVSGGVQCWGRNDDGQAGAIDSDEFLTPRRVPQLTNIVALAAGERHTCALSRAGAVHCWGNYKADGVRSPVELVIPSGAVELVAGSRHTCALRSNGLLQCWGSNDHGQLGIYGGDGASL
ncbi:hypothetical protein LZC95_05230 [Pendulispora brunnea]|uniref:Uncharacterized protein n=1 Tax=Pendulispora brunnea TaxID=2905690 RepID=A0ABZ2KC54_9BACT